MKGFAARIVALQELALDIWLAGRRHQGLHRILGEKMSSISVCGGTCPGHRTIAGTRSRLPNWYFSHRGTAWCHHRATRTSRRRCRWCKSRSCCWRCRDRLAFSGAVRLARHAPPCRPDRSRARSYPGTAGLSRVQMCMRLGLNHTKNGFVSPLAPSMKSSDASEEFLVDRLHALLGEWAGVLAFLFAHGPEAGSRPACRWPSRRTLVRRVVRIAP